MFGSAPFASQSQTLAMGFAPSTQVGAGPEAAKRPRQEDKQTCLPVTVRMVEQALEQRADSGSEALRFHDTEPGMLIFVGMVEAMTRQPASIEFSLNDATGRIKARYYVSDRQPKDLDELAPGRHVSVFGGIRTAPEVHLAVTGMRLVQSADEVSFHLIEAAHAALRLRRGHLEPETPSKQPATARTAATMAGSAPMDLSPQKSERPQELAAPVAPATEPAKPRAALSGEGLRKAVFAFLQREGDGRPEGVSLAAICNHADPAPADEVSAALELLVNDGEVYTTIDDGHFQCV
uniref:Replication protein A 32 kDa subunit n=1 Tax=Lingulaulax polyedra TaxID=160621 RepID=A0A516AFW9_LINPO|nr:replication protein A 32 kDa subunit [Lingulodinium polyedra]